MEKGRLSRFAGNESSVGCAVSLLGVAGVVQLAEVEVSFAHQRHVSVLWNGADDDRARGREAADDDQCVVVAMDLKVGSSKTWSRTTT